MPRSDKLEEKISWHIRDNKSEVVGGLVGSFTEACGKAYEKQERNSADSISYISFSLLYINFINRKPLYLIETFNDKWFFSSSISEHSYDPEWMTSLIYEFHDDALAERRKYLGKIHPTMVEKVILTVLDRQANLLSHLVKDTLGSINLEEIEAFGKLRRERLRITIGKYRGAYSEIYRGE